MAKEKEDLGIELSEIEISPDELKELLGPPPELAHKFDKVINELFKRNSGIIGALVNTRTGIPIVAHFKIDVPRELIDELHGALSAFTITSELQLREIGLGFLQYALINADKTIVLTGMIGEDIVFAIFAAKNTQPGLLIRDFLWFRNKGREIVEKLGVSTQ